MTTSPEKQVEKEIADIRKLAKALPHEPTRMAVQRLADQNEARLQQYQDLVKERAAEGQWTIHVCGCKGYIHDAEAIEEEAPEPVKCGNCGEWVRKVEVAPTLPSKAEAPDAS